MPTPDWRAEKSGDLIKLVCDFLVRAKADNGGSLPDPIPLSRDAVAGLLWHATKLYCDANEERLPDREDTWSPELPDFLLDHPERCDETLGIVADHDYRDPYYDRPTEEGIMPDLKTPAGFILELRHQGIPVARGESLRGLEAKASEVGLHPDFFLELRNALCELIRLPKPDKSVMIFLEWDLWTIPST